MIFSALKYLYLSLAISLFSACSSCKFPDNENNTAPEWVCQPEMPGYKYTALGYAEHSAAGLSFMKQMAAANGRQKLANKRKQQSKKTLTDTELINTQIIQSTLSPKGNLYVLIGLKDEQ